jgi:hypothetical protein
MRRRLAIVGQPQHDRREHRRGDQCEGEKRTGKPHHRNDEQRRDRRTDDRAQPERRGQRRQRRHAPAAARARSEVGLRRRRRSAAKAAVDRPEDCEQGEGQTPAHPAVKPAEQCHAAQRHRQNEAADAHHRQRLASVVVALLRPIWREQHPQHRRPGVGDGDVEIADADLAPDGRHDRLERRVARRGDEHRAIKQHEMRVGQRCPADRSVARD